MAERVGLHVVALDAEHRGQLAGVRGEQRRDEERLGQVLEGARVDDDGNAVLERLGEQVADVIATARADHPGLHPSGAGDDLGRAVDDARAQLRRADEAHHAGGPGLRARDGEVRGAGVLLGAGGDADHATGVLVADRAVEPAERRGRAGGGRRPR